MRYAAPTYRASYNRQMVPPARARITFRIDDGFADAYTNARPILQARGMVGSVMVPTAYIGQAGYMNAAQLQALQAAGWEVGSHTRNNVLLTGLTEAEQRTELEGSKADLEALGLTARSFAPPSNAWNAALQALAIEAGYALASTGYQASTPYHEAYPLPNAMNLQRSISISSQAHTTADVTGWIQEAVAAKAWLTLLFHNVRNVDDAYSTSTTMFREIVAHVAASGAEVVTLYEGLWGTPRPPTLYDAVTITL